MNISKFASIAAVTLLAGVAQAQSVRITVPDQVPVSASTLTRAEVLADFHIWRAAGLQDLNRGDATPDTQSLAYRQAQAKYESLHASPQFSALVDKLSRHPNAQVVVTK